MLEELKLGGEKNLSVLINWKWDGAFLMSTVQVVMSA